MLNYLKRKYFFSFSFEIYFGPIQNQERVGLNRSTIFDAILAKFCS